LFCCCTAYGKFLVGKFSERLIGFGDGEAHFVERLILFCKMGKLTSWGLGYKKLCFLRSSALLEGLIIFYYGWAHFALQNGKAQLCWGLGDGFLTLDMFCFLCGILRGWRFILGFVL